MPGHEILVAHPVPVRWMPRRGRYERLSFRTGLAPARVRGVRRADLGEGVPFTGPRRIHAFEGGLWTAWGQTAALLATLSNPDRLLTLGSERGAAAVLPQRTPLQACHYLALNAAEWPRPDPHPPGALIADLGDEAGEAARRFVAERIVDVDGDAYVRIPAPAVPLGPDCAAEIVPSGFLDCELDRIGDHDRLSAALGFAPSRNRPFLERIRDDILALQPCGFAGDDAVRFANGLPQMLHVAVRPNWGAGRIDSALTPGLAADLMAALARGSVGLIAAEGVEDAAALGLRVLDALPPAQIPDAPGQLGAHCIRPYIEEIVKPWAERFAPVAAEDAISLGALGT